MDRKLIFDAVRRVLGRGFRRPEVAALDEAIDRAQRTTLSPSATAPSRRIGPRGLVLIKRFEGCRLRAYPDPATGGAPWTIGWGTTWIGGKPVRPGQTITQDEADALLGVDLVRYAGEVEAALEGAPTSEAQFDALISFHYNTGAIARATLTRHHREGDFARAAREFARWTRAGGRVMPGLVRRRAAEEALYRSSEGEAL